MASRRDKPAEEGAPAWIVTFSDLMSLLLTFFVLLLSFSTISEDDFNKAMMSMQGALGVLEMNTGMVAPMMPSPQRSSNPVSDAARRLRQRLQELDRDRQVKINYDAHGGLKINLPGNLLFERGSATLQPGAYPVLGAVSEVLRELPEAFVEVRGHTDASPVPAGARYEDNFGLSFERASAVARRLYTVGEVPRTQFEIVALGPNQPLATNETEEGRDANRRVEVYVRGLVDRSTIEGLPPGGAAFESIPEPPAGPGI